MKIFCLISVSRLEVFLFNVNQHYLSIFIFQENKITFSLSLNNQSCLKSSHLVSLLTTTHFLDYLISLVRERETTTSW